MVTAVDTAELLGLIVDEAEPLFALSQNLTHAQPSSGAKNVARSVEPFVRQLPNRTG